MVRKYMLRKAFQFILGLFAGTSAVAAQDSLSILFIGNSFTHMNDMPGILDKLAKSKGKKLIVEKSTHSGFSFQQHSARKDMYAAIKKRKWDYVVLQGWSKEFIFPYQYLDTATIPYIQGIVDSVKANNPCTNLLFYMTWGYEEGNTDVPNIETFEKMGNKIADGYAYVSALFDIPIVPVGMVWQRLRSETSIHLYDPDKYHPNRNGSYAAACSFYTALFRESPDGAITKTIASKDATDIQRIASQVVLSSLNKYGLNRNYFDIQSEVTKTGEFVVKVNANYPNAKRITWNFGDGNKSGVNNTRHLYKKAGEYIITLQVEEECGIRTYKRKVKFVAPPPPIKKESKSPVKSTKKRKV